MSLGKVRRAITSALVSLVLIHVLPGESDAHLCIIRQGLESAGAAETDDRFGGAVAAGDFDGDGYEDLATGASGENQDIFGSAEHGAVVVSYGSRYGITHEDADYITIGAPADNLVRFGTSIATGDFNNDGKDDLAIGAPNSNIGATVDAGMVGIVYGHAGGVGGGPDLLLDQAGAGGASEAGDYFGFAVASADFDGDGYDDLAVGGYGEDSGAGAIFYFYGGPSGLTTIGAGWMKQTTIGYTSVANDWFGWSLAAGNVIGTDHADVVVGAPRKTVAGHTQAGQVYLIRGSPSGLLSTGALMVNESTLALDIPTAGHFGYSLALGQFFDTTGSLDLAIGEPRYDAGAITDAGRVVVVEYESIPTGGPSITVLQQSSFSEQREANDQFGFALASGDWDHDGYDDLAIGSPYEDIGTLDGAGLVQIALGGATGPGAGGEVTYDSDDLNDSPAASDNLGRAVCFGHFDDGQRANLAAGAPGKDFAYVYPPDTAATNAAGSVFIAAPWRQVQNLPCWSSISVDCEGSIVFSQKPFDRVRMASTTKAMTLLLACQWSDPSHPGYDAAHTALGSTYTVPLWVANNIGGSQANLLPYQKIGLLGLMRAMMPVSGNDAAYAIADHTTGGGHTWSGYVGTVPEFVDSMNTRAAQLGMWRTHFTTPKGSNDDEPGFPGTPGTQGAHTTAYDFAILARATMENPLAASIVGTDGWWVTSQKLVAPAVYAWALDYYSNGFFQSVEARLGGLAAGVKGGSTPEAMKTGLFAAAADSLIYGPAIVTSFRTPDGESMHDPARDMMLLALDECLAPPDILPPPVPPAEPDAFSLRDIPGCSDSLWGGAFELTGDAPDTVDIEVLAKSLPVGPSTCTLHTWRFEDIVLSGSGGWAELSFGMIDSHKGIVVRNAGETGASLVITHTGSSTPLTVSLAPGASWTSPEYDSFGTQSYVIRLSSGSPDPLELEVEVRDWQRRLTLAAEGRGIPDGPLLAGTRLSGASSTSRELCFWLEGQDRTCGNILTLTAQDHGVNPTSVEAAGGGSSVVAPHTLSIQGAPNPFSPGRAATVIRYALSKAAAVNLAVFDVEGRLVRRFVNGDRQLAGTYAVAWDGRDDDGRRLAPGVYFARLEQAGETEGTRLILMK